MARLVKLWKGSLTVDKNARLKQYEYCDGSTHYEFRDRFGNFSNVTKDGAEKIIKQLQLVEVENLKEGDFKMTTEMMMIMRFIERNMEENMSAAVAMYGYGDYASGHTYIERVCTYGHTRKILLNGGTKEDIQELADKYCGIGKSHIWFAYNNVAKEIDSIEQFIKCGLYK